MKFAKGALRKKGKDVRRKAMKQLPWGNSLWSISAAMRFAHPMAELGGQARPFRWFLGGVAEAGKADVDESKSPSARGPYYRSAELAQIEAVLLVARSPLSSRKLAQLTGLADGTKARTLVRMLNRFYDQQGCAFRVEEVAGGFQLLSRAQFAPWLQRLSPAADLRFSSPVLETLAVVAYRQPVLRVEIESIRGVQCDEMLRQLIECDLVRVVGRAEELGRPLLYGTTRRFLQLFGLRHLDELPQVEVFRTMRLSGGLPAADNQSLTKQDSPLAEEETDVKHSLRNQPFDPFDATAEQTVALAERAAKRDDDFDDEEIEEEGDDEEDDFEDDEDDFEDDEDDTWEEVEDDEEDDDEELDDDWDDDDDDWDDDDDDWDDDDDEEFDEEDEEE